MTNPKDPGASFAPRSRRYTEDEIAVLLEHAGAAQERTQDSASLALTASDGEGLTLAQVQEIATEVGIAPEFVASAARALDRGELVPTQQRKWFGLPIGVSRTINFGRVVSDEEWEHIVVTLRETFDARGRVQRDGSFRQWTNGNLQALLEPTRDGHRLRLTTRKGDATSRAVLGVTLVAAGTLSLMAVLLRGQGIALPLAMPPILISLAGVATLLSVTVQLPRWARTRSQQMESIAVRMSDAALTLPKRP